MQQLVINYSRCLRCGCPINDLRRKYCQLCATQSIIESKQKYYLEKLEKIKKAAELIDSYDYATDSEGYQCIDETHANWDTIIVDKVCIKRLGTISEWDLDKRIYKLKKQVEKNERK